MWVVEPDTHAAGSCSRNTHYHTSLRTLFCENQNYCYSRLESVPPAEKDKPLITHVTLQQLSTATLERQADLPPPTRINLPRATSKGLEGADLREGHTVRKMRGLGSLLHPLEIKRPLVVKPRLPTLPHQRFPTTDGPADPYRSSTAEASPHLGASLAFPSCSGEQSAMLVRVASSEQGWKRWFPSPQGDNNAQCASIALRCTTILTTLVKLGCDEQRKKEKCAV